MLTSSIAELLTLAANTDPGDVDALAVLGLCMQVCVFLDPATSPDLKISLAKSLAEKARRTADSLPQAIARDS